MPTELFNTKTNWLVVQELLQRDAIIIHRVILIAIAIAIFQDRRWMMSHAW